MLLMALAPVSPLNMTKEYYQNHRAELAEKKRAYENTPEAHTRKLARQERYDHTEKARIKREKYWDSEKGKAVLKRASAKKLATEKGQAQHKAHGAIFRAVKTGRIVKCPCSVCGDVKSFAHHHKGYALENVFVITWLCRKHHNEAHKG